jgi:hypothetical protein
MAATSCWKRTRFSTVKVQASAGRSASVGLLEAARAATSPRLLMARPGASLRALLAGPHLLELLVAMVRIWHEVARGGMPRDLSVVLRIILRDADTVGARGSLVEAAVLGDRRRPRMVTGQVAGALGWLLACTCGVGQELAPVEGGDALGVRRASCRSWHRQAGAPADRDGVLRWRRRRRGSRAGGADAAGRAGWRCACTAPYGAEVPVAMAQLAADEGGVGRRRCGPRKTKRPCWCDRRRRGSRCGARAAAW